MQRPPEIEEHQKDYKEGAWTDYTEDEYSYWVRLLAKRALHRSTNEGKKKDLTDARNYLLMWLSKL